MGVKHKMPAVDAAPGEIQSASPVSLTNQSDPNLSAPALRCDVLVAGGGSAGLAAGVAAARAGARTVLVERCGFLGGMGTAALVHTICGLYLLREEPGAVFANPGLAPEFATRLLACGGARPAVRMGRLDVLPHDPSAFAAVADELAASTPNLRVLFHSELAEASGDGASLASAEVLCRGRRQRIEADAFVDTTGDATLTALAGAAWSQIEPARLQRPAYIFQLRGVPPAMLEEAGRLRLIHAIATAVKMGDLPRAWLGCGFRAGLHAGDAWVTLDLAGDDGDGTSWDPASAEALTGVEQAGRRLAGAFVGWAAAHVDGLAGCFVGGWPVRAGVRESRRMAGVYEVTGGDVAGAAEFDDSIALATWPMELRERPTGPRWTFPESGRAAGIPLRCLRHRDVANLFAAGRCLSATHEAQASIRVMGTCLATGEAAGLAAALHVRGQTASMLGWGPLAREIRRLRVGLTPEAL